MGPVKQEEISMSRQIKTVRALEILDSRGNPTLRVTIGLDNGIVASASVPSGASTGENEAVELRDGDKKRYGGKGVLKAVANVNNTIGPALVGMDPHQQEKIDRLMIAKDGTANKGKLGANAILGVSMAVARAAVLADDVPLYRYLGGPKAFRLPAPMMNILNGGKHADNSVDFQEYMVIPLGASTFAEALRYGAETFHALKGILHKKGYATSVGDEGGFAPNLKSNDEACEVILEAIAKAGYKPGKDVALALDPAASSFWDNGTYDLCKSGQDKKNSSQMTALYRDWVRKYPIVSIEDGLAENDWDGFVEQTAILGKQEGIQIVGDGWHDQHLRPRVFHGAAGRTVPGSPPAFPAVPPGPARRPGIVRRPAGGRYPALWAGHHLDSAWCNAGCCQFCSSSVQG
jgi:enolase